MQCDIELNELHRAISIIVLKDNQSVATTTKFLSIKLTEIHDEPFSFNAHIFNYVEWQKTGMYFRLCWNLYLPLATIIRNPKINVVTNVCGGTKIEFHGRLSKTKVAELDPGTW